MSQLVPALILFLVPLAYSPGPGNLAFAAAGARFGLAATLPASAGYHLATWVVTFLIGLGVIGGLQAAPGLARALQIAGAGYVLWLAWRVLRAGPLGEAAKARPIGPIDGALLLLLNPKAYVIIALMFTQFAPMAADLPGATALITTIFTLNNLVAFLVWTLAGDLLGRWFRSPRAARRLNLGLGLMLAGVAVWLLTA
ncbi:MAG: putative threonine efflux protein [Rhodobacteraceae bacterium HLUCCA08]|nr:MAG: putative threonine efflux protein [Rhodobacteraceae bacterium HLUCCA08]